MKKFMIQLVCIVPVGIPLILVSIITCSIQDQNSTSINNLTDTQVVTTLLKDTLLEDTLTETALTMETQCSGVEKIQPSLKGYNLMASKSQDDTWLFTLVSGTNRMIPDEELYAPGSEVELDGWIRVPNRSLSDILDILCKLPPHTPLLANFTETGVNALPSELHTRLTHFCQQQNLDLQFSPM